MSVQTVPSLYQQECQAPEGRGTAQKNISCQVAVIGGGLSGISTALGLAEQGLDVCVFEAETFGRGASGRNGGHICIGWSGSFDRLVAQLGTVHDRMLFDAGLEGARIISEKVKAHQIDCDLRWGYLHAGYHQRHMDELAEMKEQFESYGVDEMTLLDSPEQVKSYLNTDAYAGGLYEQTSGHLNPMKYLVGLVKAAQAAGAHLYSRSPVASIEMSETGAHKLLLHNDVVVTADRLVICGNAYLKKVAPTPMRSRLAPVSSSVLATAPLSAEQAARLFPYDVAVADCNTALNYFRLDARRRLIFGGRASYLNIEPANLEADLRKRMVQIFPELQTIAAEACWSGHIGITVSRHPHFGRLARDVYFVQGYSGQGVAMSGVAGRVITEAICKQSDRFDLFSQISHMPFPGGPARTAVLALGMGWYKFTDWLKSTSLMARS